MNLNMHTLNKLFVKNILCKVKAYYNVKVISNICEKMQISLVITNEYF